MPKTAIMLGGNLPDTLQMMDFALKQLEKGGFKVEKISKIFHSEAEDCVPDTPDFLDRAVTGVWNGTADELLKLTQSIEIASGRPAVHSSRESRVLDIDLILFGDEIVNTPHLTIPHPRALQRRFVLEPLAEIAPDWNFPGKITVSEALKKLNP